MHVKKALLIFIFTFFVFLANSQSGYLGLNFDFNSSLRTQHTFAGDFHAEARLGKQSNWYLNWDFALGANVQSDFYARANILILAYGSRDFWRSLGNSNNGGAVICMALAPLLCPVGLTNYFYTSYNGDFRMGIYLNPMHLDYWDSKNPVRSWSVHGGLKILYHWQGNSNIYLKFGGINIFNTFTYKNADKENGVLFNFSVGTLFGVN